MHAFYINILSILTVVLIYFNAHAQNIKEVQRKVNDFLSQNNFNAAIQFMNNMIVKFPNNDTLITMQGLIYLDNQFNDKAQELFEKALQINSNNITAKFSLAETYTIQRNFLKAKKLFGELLNEFSNKSIILNYLAQIAIAENDYPSVKKYFTQLFEIDSTNIDALNSLGVLALMNGDLDESEILLNKSVLYSKNNINAYYNLGVLYLFKEDYKKAEINLIEALKIDSTDAKILYTLGIVYLVSNKYDKSKLYLENSIKYNPYNIDALIGLYIIRQFKKERESVFDGAYEIIKQIEKISPNYEQLNLLKADYYYSINDIQKAIYYTELEIKKNPKLKEGYYILSMLYSQIGNEDKAKEYKIVAEQISTNQNANNLSLVNYLKITMDSKSEIHH